MSVVHVKRSADKDYGFVEEMWKLGKNFIPIPDKSCL